LIVAIVVTFFLLTPFSICQGSPSFNQVKNFKNEADNLQTKLNRIVGEYNFAYNEYVEIVCAEKKSEEKLKKLKKELRTREEALNLRLKAIYMHEKLSFLHVLMDSTDFNDFLSRFYVCEKISARDAKVINEAKRLRIEFQKENRDMEVKRIHQRALLDRLSKKQKEMEGKFEKAKTLLSGVEKSPQVKSRIIKGVRIKCFPVANPYAYGNSWLAPRKGHRHQGCDVFAAKGTPCYACVSGRARISHSHNGGKSIYLNGDDGDVFYYMHLNGFAVTDGHVEAGQVIGYVGDTGNARGGACHLHFEVHPKGGKAVNPYPVLRGVG